MDRSKISWGLALLVIGAIWLLTNLDVIDFSWMAVFRFWPLIIILVGINIMLPKDSKGNYAYGFFVLVCLSFLVYQGVVGKYGDFNIGRVSMNGNRIGDGADGIAEDEQLTVEGGDEHIASAKLKMELAAASYRLDTTSKHLIMVDMPKNSPRHSLSSKIKGALATLTLKTKSNRGNMGGKRISVLLHPEPVWDVEADFGAGEAQFDMSMLKLQKLKLESGASSFDLKLGSPLKESKINIETGVSSTKVHLPKGVSCRLKVKSAMSSTNLSGFKKIDDDTYESDGFDSSANRYVIIYEGGLSSFSVNWY